MNKSLLKAIEVLDCFIENSELTLLEIMQITDLSKTTAFRLASSLEEGGLLVKEKKASNNVIYRLSLKMLTYGKLVDERLNYSIIAIPFMRKLNKELNELVHLTVMEGNQAVYIKTLKSSKPLRLVVQEGATAPLHAGSAPKLLLANLSPKQVENYLEGIEVEKITENTITNKEKLKSELDKIRMNGYSVSHSENFKQTVGFSFPIYNHMNQIQAALGVSMPENDYTPEREKIILEKLEVAAKEISEQLGFLGD